MSRKDYEVIAAYLRGEMKAYRLSGHLEAAEAVDRIAGGLAAMLKSDNPRFDVEKFMAAVRGGFGGPTNPDQGHTFGETYFDRVE